MGQNNLGNRTTGLIALLLISSGCEFKMTSLGLPNSTPQTLAQTAAPKQPAVQAHVTSVSPDYGTVGIGGSTAILVTGTDFVAGASVSIGGAPCAVTLITPTSIACKTGSGAPAGAADVVVTNPGVEAGVLQKGFTFQLAPTLISAAPFGFSAIPAGTLVTITGYAISTAATITVSGSNQSCGNIHVNESQTQLTCNVTGTGTGPLTLTVNNPAGASASIRTALAAPTITAVSPITGAGTGGTTLTITGTGFEGVTTVKVGSTPCASFALVDSSKLTCITPTGTGSASITITNSDMQTVTGGTYAYQPVFLYGSSKWGAALVDPATGGIKTGVSGTLPTGKYAMAVVFHPKKPFAYYLLTDSASAPTEVASYNISGTDGSLSAAGTPLSTELSTGYFQALAISPDGKHVFAADGDDIVPLGIDATTGIVTTKGTAVGATSTIEGTPITERYVQSIAVDPSGKYLYAAFSQSGLCSFSIGSTGALTQITSTNPTCINYSSGGSSTDVAPLSPMAIAVDATGKHAYAIGTGGTNLFYYNIGADGALSYAGVAQSGAGSGASGGALAVTASGFIFYGFQSNRLGYSKVNASGVPGAISWITLPDSPKAASIKWLRVDPSEKYLYASDSVNGKIHVYTIGSSGLPTEFSSGSPLSLSVADFRLSGGE